MKIEEVILNSLVCNEEFSRKTIPFLKDEYFHESEYKTIFNTINEYVQKYNSLPSEEAISIAISKLPQNDDEQKKCQGVITEIFKVSESPDSEWLINEAEAFCKEKAVYNAILESIHIIDGKSKDKSENAIPSILSDALAVAFDTHIGHDYIEDADERYDFYHKKEDKIEFDLELFNTITANGVPRKTLNIVMAGTRENCRTNRCKLNGHQYGRFA